MSGPGTARRCWLYSKAKELLSRFDGRDLTVGMSLVMIGAGLAMVSVALALIVPGLLLFALAIWPLVAVGGKS